MDPTLENMRIDHIIKERHELENSLYREMQENEANRTKIRILTEALDGKIQREYPMLRSYIKAA